MKNLIRSKIIELNFFKLILMPQGIPDNAGAPEEGGYKIEEDCHAEGRDVKHGEEVACKARDAAGHTNEVVVRGALFAFLEKPGFGTFKDFVANTAEENIHPHTDYPENEHIKGSFGINKIENTCGGLKGKKRKH